MYLGLRLELFENEWHNMSDFYPLMKWNWTHDCFSISYPHSCFEFVLKNPCSPQKEFGADGILDAFR